ncbi:agmatine deiminase family protein [Coralloluteibacterium stylophorae]|uniref:Agmatine deiminase family protein n=1 Tax=Coralloluteibacterium stylophorae TaxID=1776034 RepID=A0A8J7VXT3_9GAMM|nr:agmatine deiminase family protein [Coralloluteibacterium stylophorae]MBS7455984.1 agmatine deiminase family protein [Coralloluteibacterium stylophorae]
MKSYRFPAEWERQSAVVVAWPHSGTDWAPRLAEVERSYVKLVDAIARRQPVLVCVPDAAVRQHAAALLINAAVDESRLHFVEVAYDDTWLRDSGPVTLACEDERGRHHRLLDFRFTGWGGKFEAGRDDRLVQSLHAAGVFGDASLESVEFALEGGAIESDGRGTLLTTWRCLHERHPEATREALTERLKQALRVERVLWLEHGYLEGDDTDAHVDTLARFAPDDAIVYQACDDAGDSHHAELAAMAAELAGLRTADDRPYRLFALPWAQPIRDGERRLAASYANFLIVNGAVLMPAYDDPADAAARAVLEKAFPDHEIVPVPCRPLIWQNGSLHCVTMQLPAGLI